LRAKNENSIIFEKKILPTKVERKHGIKWFHGGIVGRWWTKRENNMADKNWLNSVNCVVCGRKDRIMKRCGRCQSIFYWYYLSVFNLKIFILYFITFTVSPETFAVLAILINLRQ
jgi:hypothetical protein